MDEIAIKLNYRLLVIRSMQQKHGKEKVKFFKIKLLEDAEKQGYKYDAQNDEFVKFTSS